MAYIKGIAYKSGLPSPNIEIVAIDTVENILYGPVLSGVDGSFILGVESGINSYHIIGYDPLEGYSGRAFSLPFIYPFEQINPGALLSDSSLSVFVIFTGTVLGLESRSKSNLNALAIKTEQLISIPVGISGRGFIYNPNLFLNPNIIY